MYLTGTTEKKESKFSEKTMPLRQKVFLFCFLLFSYPLGEVTWSYLTGHLCNVISG